MDQKIFKVILNSFNVFTKLFLPIMVSLSQDIMALLNLALEKFLKSPLQQMSTS